MFTVLVNALVHERAHVCRFRLLLLTVCRRSTVDFCLLHGYYFLYILHVISCLFFCCFLLHVLNALQLLSKRKLVQSSEASSAVYLHL